MEHLKIFKIINFKKFKLPKTIPFTIAPKAIKHLRIHLTKEMKDLYNENWKILMKQMEEDNKWKDIFCSWIGKIDILPEVTYRFNRISNKTLKAIFMEIEETILKFVGNSKN